MRNFAVLTAALEMVEQRLCEPMSAADLARSCYSSYSGLRNLFAQACHCSVSEYITKRRLSRASRELLAGDRSVTEIAFDYQYGSPEAFSRAFRRFWGIPPSEFRKTRRFAELYPKFILEKENGGVSAMSRKSMDISELYDELKARGGMYVLSIDMINFAMLNDQFGHAAGDSAIAEAFARLDREVSGDMLLFRIGGDEFAIVTQYTSVADAEALARRIAARNGESVKYGEREIPLSLRVGISRIPDRPLNYHKALGIMYGAISEARKESDHVAVYRAAHCEVES